MNPIGDDSTAFMVTGTNADPTGLEQFKQYELLIRRHNVVGIVAINDLPEALEFATAYDLALKLDDGILAQLMPVVLATPTPRPTYALEVISWRCYESDTGSYMFTEGEVKNVSGTRLENVTAVVTYRTSNGEFVTTDTALITYNPILAGQVSPFSVITSNNPAITKCSLGFKDLLGGSISHGEALPTPTLTPTATAIPTPLALLGFETAYVPREAPIVPISEDGFKFRGSGDGRTERVRYIPESGDLFEVHWRQTGGAADTPILRIVGEFEGVFREVVGPTEGEKYSFQITEGQHIWIEVDANEPITWEIVLLRCPPNVPVYRRTCGVMP